MTLGTLLLLILAAYGYYRIFRFSELGPVKWARDAYKRLWGSKAEELFKCPLCLGTHIGVVMTFMYFLPVWVLLAPACAAAIYIIHECLTLLDEIICLFMDDVEVN